MYQPSLCVWMLKCLQYDSDSDSVGQSDSTGGSFERTFMLGVARDGTAERGGRRGLRGAEKGTY